MNRELREELKRAFEPTPPKRKEEFLKRLKLSKMSLPACLLIQAGYVRKRFWGSAAAVFVMSWAGTVVFSANMLWIISAFLPILAQVFLSESGRSETYAMAELELATRFSLRSVVLARLGILGMADLLFFCLLLPFGMQNNDLGPVKAGIYMLVPFLLTVFAGLYIVRKVRGREAVCMCAGAAVLVSSLTFFSHSLCPQAYGSSCFAWWIVAALILGAGTAKQCCKIIRETEELAWN